MFCPKGTISHDIPRSGLGTAKVQPWILLNPPKPALQRFVVLLFSYRDPWSTS